MLILVPATGHHLIQSSQQFWVVSTLPIIFILRPYRGRTTCLLPCMGSTSTTDLSVFRAWMPNPYPCLLHLCKRLWLLVIANWLCGLTFANPRKSNEIWSANSQHRLAGSGVSLLRSRSSSPVQVTVTPASAWWSLMEKAWASTGPLLGKVSPCKQSFNPLLAT